MTKGERFAITRIRYAKERLEEVVSGPSGIIRDLRVLNTLNDSLAGLTACIMAIEEEG